MIGQDEKYGFRTGVVLVSALVTGGVSLAAYAQAPDGVDILISVDENCDIVVEEQSGSCQAMGIGAGPDDACGTAGATVLRWYSDNGEAFTIEFKGASPLGEGRSYRSNSAGRLNAPIPPSTAAGDYAYGVVIGQCVIDPKIIVR